MIIILLIVRLSFVLAKDYDDLSYNQLVLSDWDSTLYNKPLCVPIPSNMSLCSNINYKEMKMPNLLGHETMDEIEYQSRAWLPLLSIQCSKDTQLFLCSLFAPVCVEQAAIYPCRSLCESVKQSCSNKMLSYGYQWPEIFNCSKFPDNNGLCIQPPTQESTTTIQTTTVESTTIKAPVTKTTPGKKSNIGTCHGCADNSTISSLKNIVTSYCNSDLVIRGRIPSIKPSRFDMFKPKLRQNKTLSQFISVPKRDRKVLKGARFISNNYMTERSMFEQTDDYPDEDDDGRNDELDVYLLSNYHLNLATSLQKNIDIKRLRMRSLTGQNQCKCDRLKKNLKPKMKYLLFGNVLRIKKINLKPVDSLKLMRRNRAINNEILAQKSRRNLNGKQLRFVKLVYLNGIYSWHSARAFIDYIEDDTLNKEDMCIDIDATVDEINRIRNLLI